MTRLVTWKKFRFFSFFWSSNRTRQAQRFSGGGIVKRNLKGRWESLLQNFFKKGKEIKLLDFKYCYQEYLITQRKWS